MQDLRLYLTLVLAAGILAQWLAWRLRIPSILLLLVFGFALGHWANTDEMLGDLLFPIVSFSVAVILFEGGMSLKLAELKEAGGAVTRLVTVGVVVTWVLAAIAGCVFLNWDWRIAALVGAILTVTGPTVISPLLRHVRPSRRVASMVKWEGIVVDPVGAVLAVLVFEAVLRGGHDEPFVTALLHLLGTVGLGVALAVITAFLLVQALRRYWIPDHLHNPVFLAVAIGVFAISNLVFAESGLLTVTLLGILLANQKVVTIRHVVEFKEILRTLLISGLFIVLASRVHTRDLIDLGWGTVAFIVALIVVVRPVSVLLATWGSSARWNERIFLSLLAPRGIVAAAVTSVFAIEVTHLIETGLLPEELGAQAAQMPTVVFVVILVTVSVYGLAASPLARRLGLANSNRQGVLFAGSDPWVRPIAIALHQEGIPVLMVDTNFRSIAAARMAGLPTVCASILSELVTEEADLSGLGRLLAMTPSDEVNTLAAMAFVHEFGRAEIYQLPAWDSGSGRRESVSQHMRGRILFGEGAKHANLAQRFLAGQQVKKTRITEEFSYEDFRRKYGEDTLLLFVLHESGKLSVATVGEPLKPQAGDLVMALVQPLETPEEAASSKARIKKEQLS